MQGKENELEEVNGEIGGLALKIEELEKQKRELETSIANKVQDRIQFADEIRVRSATRLYLYSIYE